MFELGGSDLGGRDGTVHDNRAEGGGDTNLYSTCLKNISNRQVKYHTTGNESTKRPMSRIMGADKGDVNVVMSTGDYLIKSKSNLNEGPYKRIHNMTVNAVMNKSKQEVAKCLKTVEDNLVPGGCFKIYAHTADVPRFYGLQKAQKQLVPLRRVVDWEESPTHELTRSIARILKPLTGGKPSTIKKGVDFSQKVRTLRVSNEEVTVSLHVNLYIQAFLRMR